MSRDFGFLAVSIIKTASQVPMEQKDQGESNSDNIHETKSEADDEQLRSNKSIRCTQI